jgi:riboflavin synthase
VFTGLVTEAGEVVSLTPEGNGAAIRIKAEATAGEAAIGDSISINGTCLTVTSIEGPALGFHASSETLGATTLGELRPGARVNLEPSLRPTDRMGGHFVTGHVDAVGKVKSRTPEGQAVRFEIAAPGEVLKYLVDKGSVAVDGVSLTVVKVLRESFTLVIIPHTAEVTTFGGLRPGDRVNLEADILGKYVHRYITRAEGGDKGLMDALREHGFTAG